jgi:hypothetical protein
MTAFPTLIPSTRTFTPGEYPHTAYQAYSGQENRVRHSNVMLSSTPAADVYQLDGSQYAEHFNALQ